MNGFETKRMKPLWRMIRNRLIPGYLGIDDDPYRGLICDEVPELLPVLKALKKEAQP